MKKCSYIVLCVLLAACAHPKALVYKDVESLQVRLIQDPPVTIYVRFYNPNSYPLRFKDGMVNITVDNTAVGSLTVDTSITAPPLSAFTLPLSLHADLRKVLPSASQFIFRDSVAIRLHGYVKAGEGKGATMRIPVHYEGFQQLERPQMMLQDER